MYIALLSLDYMLIIVYTMYMYMHMNKVCVTTEKKCATLYSCFQLVGRHQQGVAHLLSGVTGVI